jgi:hypothetical protein
VVDGPTLNAVKFIGCFFPLIFLHALVYSRFSQHGAVAQARLNYRAALGMPIDVAARQREDCAVMLMAILANVPQLNHGRFFANERLNPSVTRRIDLAQIAEGAALLVKGGTAGLLDVVSLDTGGVVSDKSFLPSTALALT